MLLNPKEFEKYFINWVKSVCKMESEIINIDGKTIHGCPSGLMFHSDQGSEYRAKVFRRLLDEKKATRLFLRKVTHLTTP